jgi:hypothetical protein
VKAGIAEKMAFENPHIDHSAHGATFYDMFAAVELGATLIGHGLSLADAAALAAIASEVSQAHGGPSEPHDFQTGHPCEIPVLAAAGWHAADAPAGDHPISLPGIARDQSSVQVLHWPHGQCDPQNEIRSLALQEGMVLFPPWENGGITDMHKVQESIVPVKPQQKPPVMPNGWYEGATGSTSIWGESFRLRPSFLVSDTFDNRRTFLIVMGRTWHYGEVMDYETHVACLVYSFPFFQGGKWMYEWDKVKCYRNMAEILAKSLKVYLEQHPPGPHSIAARRFRTEAAKRAIELSVRTCSSVAGYQQYEAQWSFKGGEQLWVYAEVQNVKKVGGRVDLAFEFKILNDSDTELMTGFYPQSASWKSSAWFASYRFALPQDLAAGLYYARVDFRDNISGETRSVSTSFQIIAASLSGLED